MVQCWKMDPKERPSFGDLLDLLLDAQRVMQVVNSHSPVITKKENWLRTNTIS